MTPAEWYARQRARSAFDAAERRRAAGDAEGAIAGFDEAARLSRKFRRPALDAVATILIEAGRHAEAAERLRSLVELDKKDVKSWRRLARILRQTEPNAAIKAWRRVMDVEPQDLEANKALAEMLPKDSAESVAPLRILAEADPQDPKRWRRLAKALEHNGDAEAAKEALEQALAADPGDAQTRDQLVGVLDGLGRGAETLGHLRVMAEADPGKIKPWKRLARRLGELDRGAEAFTVWRRVLSLDPKDPQAHSRMIDLLLAQGLKARALPHMRAAAEAGGTERGAWRRLARTLVEIDRSEEAAGAWRRLLEIDPADVEAHRALAELFADRPAEAAPHLKALAEATPKKTEVWKRLGEAQAALGQTADAVEAFRRALKVEPDDVEAHAALAELLKDRKAAALPHLRVLAEAGSGRGAARRRIAEILEKTGDKAGALEAWEASLEIEPAHVDARRRAAGLLREAGRTADAAEHLRLAAEQAGDDEGLWRRLAGAFSDLGDAEAELGAWRRVLALVPGDLQAHERLASNLEKLGRSAEAALHLRALAEAEPDRAKTWKRLARQLEDAGAAEDAAGAWGRVLALQADDLQAQDRLGQLLVDLGRFGEAAPHLKVLAEAESHKPKVWKRLALCLHEAGDAAGEAAAWQRVLALDPNDLAGRERLAAFLVDAGQIEEAVPHLHAVVRLAPDNAKAWRRYIRALRQIGQAGDEAERWRELMALAGQPELDSLLRKGEETAQRVQALKQELWAAGAEAKLQKSNAQHALSKLDREERALRAAQAQLKDEAAERRRLTAELQESRQRHRQAEAEEQSHLLTARMLGLLEPAEAEAPAPDGQDPAAEFVRAVLSDAAAGGAIVVGGGLAPELEAVAPAELGARLRRGSSKLVVLADPDAAARQAARAELAGRRSLAVLELPELVFRAAAGVRDPRTRIEPVSDDVWPNRPVMVMASDDRLRRTVVEAIGAATSLPFAPLFPAALAAKVEARELDLDDWLAAAWSAHGRTRLLGFEFDPEALTLFAREIRSGRAPIMAKVFRRATALHLAWSDKALYAADDYARRAEDLAAGFDAGDAQIEVKTYKRLIHRDVRLESALDQIGKFRPATVKVYRELFDKPALGRFCRDASLALGVAGFAEVDEAQLAFRPTADVERMGALVSEAVRSLTATRDVEPPPAGLIEFGLGRSLEALGRHAEAQEAYQEAVRKAPTYFPARAAAARYLELSGKAGEAERLLRQGLGNGTPDPDVQEGLLGFYQRNGSPLGVAATSRLMMKRGQSRPAIAAPALIELGRYRDAEPLLGSLAARLAGQDTFLADLIDLPRLAAELPVLHDAAAADPDDSAAQLRLAEALRRLGRLPEALAPYRRALAQPGLLESELGVSDRCRPQFLMVGPPRTGTTLLRRLFDLHPQIAAPPGELFFFSNRSGQRAGSNRQRAPLGWYLDAFKAAAEAKPDAKVLGEKTPHYFSMPDEQMAFASLLMPGLKVIVTLRDPVVRAWSEIKVQRRVTEAEVVAALSRGAHPGWFDEILDAGRYVSHLKRWLKHVSPERILLVDADALETNVVEEARRIFRFLGVRDLGQRQVTALQKGWNNRTEAFAPTSVISELLRQRYAGEPWRAEDVGRALGLGEMAPANEAGARVERPARRRAAGGAT